MHLKKMKKFNLEIRHYGTREITYKLYDDDGVSFDYEKGMYSWRTISVTKKNGKWKGTISKADKGKPNSIGEVRWRFMGSR